MPKLQLLCTLQGHQDRVWHASWSPSGHLLATCGADKTIHLWGKEGSEWVCKATLEESHQRTVRRSEWSLDGKYLAAASFDGTASVWENQDGEFENVATLEGHENEVKSVAWDCSGTLLASCSRDKSVWIWEMEQDNEFECIAVLHGHTQDVKSVKWHPNKELLASCSYDDTIKLWMAEDDDWVCVSTLTGHTSTIWEIAFDKDGDKLVSCSDDLTLIIWQSFPNGEGEPTKWKNVCKLSGDHRRCIYSVDWSHSNGLIATGSGDDAIRIFSETTDQDHHTPGTGATYSLTTTVEKAHTSDVNCVAWAPSGNLLASCGDDGFVKLWILSEEPWDDVELE